MAERSVSPSIVPGAFENYKRTCQRVDLGRIVREDEHGEWRTVPGVEGLEVSDQGWVRLFHGYIGWLRPTRGSLSGYGYYNVKFKGRQQGVHKLVCRTFHGREPSAKHTPDHINRDRADNRSSNLRWATHHEQRGNKRDSRPCRRSRPILVGLNGATKMLYPSVHKAATSLGVSAGRLSDIATKGGNTHGYTAEWAPPPETQDNLPDEQWAEATPILRVSTMGRVQQKNTRGSNWGYRHTPTILPGQVYATVLSRYVHQWVVETFICVAPSPSHTVDHKNRDRSDNRLSNLQWATKRDQSLNQTPMNRMACNNSKKKPIEVLAPGATEWQLYESAQAAIRAIECIFARLDSRNVSKAAHNGGPVKGYRFRRPAT